MGSARSRGSHYQHQALESTPIEVSRSAALHYTLVETNANFTETMSGQYISSKRISLYVYKLNVGVVVIIDGFPDAVVE